MKIYKLEINCLRGIKHLVLDFKGQNSVIYGDNGTGKSGVIDAIDFLLQGNISRIEGDGMGDLSLALHGKHVTEDVNNAWVSAEIKLPLFQEKFTVTRRLKKPKDIECLEKYKEAFLRLSSQAKMKAHFLSRREILKYINSTDSSRAKAIESLLNLDTLTKSRSILIKLQKEYDSNLKCERDSLTAINNSINEKLCVDSADDWLDAINDLRAKFNAFPLYSYKDEKILKGINFSSQEKVISQKTTLLSDIDTVISMVLNQQGLFPLLSELKDTLKQLCEFKEVQMHIKQLDLYKASLPTIEQDFCPLCGQSVIKDTLIASINKKIESLSAVDDLKKRKTSLLNSIQLKINSIFSRAEQLKRDVLSEILSEIEKLEMLKNALTAEIDVETIDCFIDTFKIETFQNYKNKLQKEIATLSLNNLQSSYNTLLDIDNLLAENFKKNAAIKKMTRSYDRISCIASTYVQLQDNWLNNLYKSIESDFSSYYRQMHHEDESAFNGCLKKAGSALSMRVDFFDGQQYPPNAVHSEGHQDSMGICLFFALSKKITNDQLELILLDDVVMSIDIDHRISFCNLLKNEFPNKQFIITTHDYIWRKELEMQQIAHSQNVFYFKAWDIHKGPLLAKSNDIWERINDDLSSGNKNEAAYLLRYYLEEFSADICNRYRLLVPYSSTARWTLEEKFIPAHKFLKNALKMARESLISYDKDTKQIDTIIERFENSYKNLNSEKWIVNPATHFTDWAKNISITELRNLTIATKAYCECLTCDNCKKAFNFTEVLDGKPKQIVCDCGENMYSCIKKN